MTTGPCAAAVAIILPTKTLLKKNRVSFDKISKLDYWLVFYFRVNYSWICLLTDYNVIPLPPKNAKTLQQQTAFKPKHQRNLSLAIPSTSKGGPYSKVIPVTSYKGQQLSRDRTVTFGKCSSNEYIIHWGWTPTFNS